MILLTAIIQDDYELKKKDTIGHFVFFLSNNTKTCTVDRLIQRIQLLACNLDTEFAMLCTMYYLLYGSEFFSDSFFSQEVTVLLKKS